MLKLMYHNTICQSGAAFISAVAATSGAAERDTFVCISQLMEYITQPDRYHPLAVARLREDVNRITYGQCKMVGELLTAPPPPKTAVEVVADIVGKAAYCAADFMRSDPQSVTQVRDCVQDCFDAWLQAECRKVQGDATPVIKMSEEVRNMLRRLGYDW